MKNVKNGLAAMILGSVLSLAACATSDPVKTSTGGECPPPEEGCKKNAACPSGLCIKQSGCSVGLCYLPCEKDFECNKGDVPGVCSDGLCKVVGTGGTGGMGTGGTGGGTTSSSSTSSTSSTSGQPTPTCTDGVKNQNEVKTDCGGSCLSCNGESCTVGQECASGTCLNAFCYGKSAGSPCVTPAQCGSGVCAAGTCQ